jgi:DNA-binding transcriptional LysR family regulator
MMVASPDYIATHGMPQSPQDLHRHNCLGYSHQADGDTWQLTERQSGMTQPVRIPTRLKCDNGDLLAQLAVADQGITALPAFLLRDHIAEHRLLQVLADWQLPDIWLTAFYPPYQRLPAAVARFTACIEGAMADQKI